MIGFGRIGLASLGLLAACLVATAALVAAAAEVPDAIAAKGETVVLELHAQGAQVYECKADSSGQLTWQFREPIAALFRNGATIGRHYGGPSWESGGGVVVAKLAGRAPASNAADIPWLKLDISERRGDGPWKDATTIQRINTKGGSLAGKCEKAGSLHSEAYSADYVFLRK